MDAELRKLIEQLEARSTARVGGRLGTEAATAIRKLSGEVERMACHGADLLRLLDEAQAAQQAQDRMIHEQCQTIDSLARQRDAWEGKAADLLAAIEAEGVPITSLDAAWAKNKQLQTDLDAANAKAGRMREALEHIAGDTPCGDPLEPNCCDRCAARAALETQRQTHTKGTETMKTLKDYVNQKQMLHGEIETITVSDLRGLPGDILTQVSLGKTFCIKRKGEVVGFLVHAINANVVHEVRPNGSAPTLGIEKPCPHAPGMRDDGSKELSPQTIEDTPENNKRLDALEAVDKD